MNKYTFPFLAVLIGFLIVALNKRKQFQTGLLLAFSGAFLLSLTVIDLLPEVYHDLDAKKTGLFIMMGILVQIFLEFFSQGAEHGHVHIHDHQSGFPWAIFISLCLHAFLEGFPIHQHNDMVYGVLVHKIPIAILITTYLYQSRFSTVQIGAFLLVFALMTPLGTLVSNTMDVVADYVVMVNAVVIGVFLHISTTILFESSKDHRFSLTKLAVIVIAVLIAYWL